MLLYYITDRNQFPGTDAERQARLLERIAEAAAAGVDCIQLREKDMAARPLAHLAEEALRRITPHRTKLLINSRLDIALAVGAAGVHLTSSDLTSSQARVIVAKTDRRFQSRDFLVGVSCHSVLEVRVAGDEGADFAVLAPIFEKVLAPTAMPPATRDAGKGARLSGIGCEAIREAVRWTNLPILALGGVSLSNAATCLTAGAAGVAAIRLFQEGDLAETVRRLRALGESPARA